MKHGTNSAGKSKSLPEIANPEETMISLLEFAVAFRNYCDCVHTKRNEWSPSVPWDKVFQIIASPLCSIKPGFDVLEAEGDLQRKCSSVETWGPGREAGQRLAKALENWENKAKSKIYLISSSYWSPLYKEGRKRHTVTNIDTEEAPLFIVGCQKWSKFCEGSDNKADPKLVDWYRHNEVEILRAIQDDDDDLQSSPVCRRGIPQLEGSGITPKEILENPDVWENTVVKQVERRLDFIKTLEEVKDFWGYEQNGDSETPQGRLWPLFLEITRRCREQELGWTLNTLVAEKSLWKFPIEIRVGVAERKEKYYTAEVREKFDSLIKSLPTDNERLTSEGLAGAVRADPVLEENLTDASTLEIPFSVVQRIRSDGHFQSIGKWLDEKGDQEEQSAEQVADNFILLVDELHNDPELQPFLAYVRAFVHVNFGFSGEEGVPDQLTSRAALVAVGGILIYLYPFLCEFRSAQASDECLSLYLFPMKQEETCIWNVVTRRPIGKGKLLFILFSSMAESLFTRPLIEDSAERIRRQARDIEALWYGEAIAHEVRVVGLAAQNEADILKQYFNQKRGKPIDPDSKEIGSMEQSVNELLDTLICLGEYADKTVDYLYSMRTKEGWKLQLLSFEDILSDKLEDKIYSLGYGKLKKEHLSYIGFMRGKLPSLCPIKWELSPSIPSINVPRIAVEIILVNLIANAVSYSVAPIIGEKQTDPNVSTPSVSISIQETEGGWHIQVCNPGSLSPVMIAFIQNKLIEMPPGGVGLSIVKHIVERYATYGWQFKYNKQESISNQQVVLDLIMTSVGEE